MNNKTKGIIYSIIFILILAGVIGYAVYKSQQPGKYDSFAQCLTERGTKYYGAFWCPNCQTQNRMFKKSKRYIDYVECSKPNKEQKEVCEEAGIVSYPTWEFADGERVTGVQSLEALAERTSCTL